MVKTYVEIPVEESTRESIKNAKGSKSYSRFLEALLNQEKNHE